MAGSDYVNDGARIGKDGASTITWQAVCDGSVIDWLKADEVIFSANAVSGAHAPDPESFKLQWRNVSDGGTFADLVTGSGELRAGTSAGCITNTDPVGSQDGCGTGTMSDSEEVENESPLQTASLTGTTDDHIEMQFCVDFINALDEKQYEFQLYSVTASIALGAFTPKITTIALTYKIDGITKDKDGTALGSCHTFLVKDNLDDTYTYKAYQLSNSSTGAYSFTGLVDNDANYQVIAWKDDTPHVFDVTDHILTPVAE